MGGVYYEELNFTIINNEAQWGIMLRSNYRSVNKIEILTGFLLLSLKWFKRSGLMTGTPPLFVLECVAQLTV